MKDQNHSQQENSNKNSNINFNPADTYSITKEGEEYLDKELIKLQNHSPQGHKVGSATGNPAEFKDTPSEEVLNSIKSNSSSGGLNLSSKINDMFEGNEDCWYHKETKKRVREFIQKLKKFNDVEDNEFLVIRFSDLDKLAGSELI